MKLCSYCHIKEPSWMWSILIRRYCSFRCFYRGNWLVNLALGIILILFATFYVHDVARLRFVDSDLPTFIYLLGGIFLCLGILGPISIFISPEK